MSAISTALAPRVSKLLLLLSSDRDGEVLAAARALGRTLRQAGLDFHDLAHAVTGPLATRRVGGDLAKIDAALRSHRISPWERQFLLSIADLLADGGELSPKQQAVLDRLMRKSGAAP